MIVGDWNAKVGEGKEDKVVGPYGLGERNEHGDRLVEFCTKHKLLIGNTLFKNHKRRRYTWKNPGDTNRNQIVYIMVRQRFRNQIIDCKAYPGADIDSDHNLVMMKCRLRFKKLKRGKGLNSWDLKELDNPEVRESLKNRINEGLDRREVVENIEEEWTTLKQELFKNAEETVGRAKRVGRKPWITGSILQFMDERRKYKNSSNEQGKQEYRRLRKNVGRECKLAKEKWIRESVQKWKSRLALVK